MPRPRLAAPVAALVLACTGTTLRAQSPATALDGRWLVSFPSNAARYVNGERIPVGTETWTFAIVRVRGDSAVATWTPESGAVVDTLRGTVRGGAGRFTFDPRRAMERPMGDASSTADGPMLVGTLELALANGGLTGRLQQGIQPPGAPQALLMQPVPVTGRRAP